MGYNAVEETWRPLANCRDHPSADIFYSEWLFEQAQAILVCQGCCVRDECLQYALLHKELLGIWGGKTEKSRKRIIRRMQRQTSM